LILPKSAIEGRKNPQFYGESHPLGSLGSLPSGKRLQKTMERFTMQKKWVNQL
jgi:hypothetical protein